ncbi:hypothetical protein MOQ_007900, partial [Trypanosoma cruzi marinkellei]
MVDCWHAPGRTHIFRPEALYASADTASSSGAHTHAEPLRLPSVSRGRDGARVVVVVGASVVVVLGASGAVVVVVVVVVGALVVVVEVVFGVCTTTEISCPCDGVSSSFTDTSSLFLRFSVCNAPVSAPESCPSSSRLFDGLLSESESSVTSSSILAVANTEEQQHRASTNRAHSRRQVIIVSVVVQWCGADLHSEGHGEQQGRREVRQDTHTEGTPHEERAAATHAPYAAHTQN